MPGSVGTPQTFSQAAAAATSLAQAGTAAGTAFSSAGGASSAGGQAVATSFAQVSQWI